MAAGTVVSRRTAVVEIPAVQPSTPKISEAENKHADFNSNSGGMSESPNIVSKNSNSDSNDSSAKSEIQMKDIVDMLKKLKLNPLAKEFFPSSYNSDSDSNDSSAKSEIQMKDIVDMLKKLKLNPLAKEFFPSSYNRDHLGLHFVPGYKNWGNDGFSNNRRRRNNDLQGRKRVNGKSFRAQREDNIRRTVYVSGIDRNITEEQLAVLFSSFGQVVDCRVCGDQRSRRHFAFVEFSDEYSAQASLNLSGTMLRLSPLKVLPSKTAILPVNPTFLPRSEDEREMCARTVYCTNIDKKVSQADVKNFFETRCGTVSQLRLLGDHVHSTHIAFVEFAMAESAIVALDCCGELLGSQRIRVSPSKTPVRARLTGPVWQ